MKKTVYIALLFLVTLWLGLGCSDNIISPNLEENQEIQETPQKQTYWKAKYVTKLVKTSDKQKLQSNSMFSATLISSASSIMWSALNNYPSPLYSIYASQLKSLESTTTPPYSRKISEGTIKTERVVNGSNITNYYYAEVEAYIYTWEKVEK